MSGMWASVFQYNVLVCSVAYSGGGKRYFWVEGWRNVFSGAFFFSYKCITLRAGRFIFSNI